MSAIFKSNCPRSLKNGKNTCKIIKQYNCVINGALKSNKNILKMKKEFMLSIGLYINNIWNIMCTQ